MHELYLPSSSENLTFNTFVASALSLRFENIATKTFPCIFATDNCFYRKHTICSFLSLRLRKYLTICFDYGKM